MRWGLALAALASAGCPRGQPAREAPPRPNASPAPAVDPAGASCEDVGSVRVCWGGGAGEPLLVPRPTPPSARSPMGWRCAGSGTERVCVDRGVAVAPFRCDGGRCAQPYPRMPDDGEWQCADGGGATICKGGEPAAGVADAPPDAAWRCGVRRGRAADSPAERICVDFSPDFPDGRAAGWRCHYEHEPRPRRVCVRDPAAPTLTAPCAPERPCLDGSRCVSGVCLPAAPRGDCWLDRDCPGNRCRFGTCMDEGA